MLLIITPLRGWRRKIMVLRFENARAEDYFEAFKVVHEAYLEDGDRETVNIRLVPITVDQLGDWLEHNVEPTWWESVFRRMRYSVTTFRREVEI